MSGRRLGALAIGHQSLRRAGWRWIRAIYALVQPYPIFARLIFTLQQLSATGMDMHMLLMTINRYR